MATWTPPPPLKGAALVAGTIALSLATFMNVLDTSIANVSIPAIAGDLAVSPDQGTWVITSFGVANAISLPLTGWLSRRFGQVRLFSASVLLFVITSFLCALAPSLPMLIVFRVLQGAVAGPMIPLSQNVFLFGIDHRVILKLSSFIKVVIKYRLMGDDEITVIGHRLV